MALYEYRCSFGWDFERRPRDPGAGQLRAREYHKRLLPATAKMYIKGWRNLMTLDALKMPARDLQSGVSFFFLALSIQALPAY
jgi:hypothetical protein